MEYLYLGIDVGGSGIRAAVFNRSGEIKRRFLDVHFSKMPNNLDLLYELRILVKEAIKDCKDGEKLAAFCIASPGPLDPNRGIIISPPNLLMIRHLSVVEYFKYMFPDIFCFLINDADAAILGEFWFGAAKGYRNVVMLTLGTGIGSSILHDGWLQTGRGMGGEWGHTTIYSGGAQRQCQCGRMNCFESFCGTIGLARTYAEFFRLKFKNLSPEDIYKVSEDMMKHRGSDSHWRAVFHAYCRNFTEAIVNISNVHHPELIVIGGGIANQIIIDTVKNYLKNPTFSESLKYCLMPILKDLKIELASCANSGIVGAVKHAIDRHESIIERYRMEHGIIS